MEPIVPLPVKIVPLVAVRVELRPPLAIARVPAKVIVPDVVIGPPDVVKPVVPPDTSIDVTDPDPDPPEPVCSPPVDIVTGKQIGRASCRERVLRLV